MQIYIGYDSPHPSAFAVAAQSFQPHRVHGLHLPTLREQGLYWRPTETKSINGIPTLWDVISDAPMSTEFAISRFLSVALAKNSANFPGGPVLFADCDVMLRRSLSELEAIVRADDSKAVWCVQHDQQGGADSKMDGRIQTFYARKNWSSVMVFNSLHPANDWLTPENVNRVPGRDLHRFCWLRDEEIGALPPEWNWLVGVNEPMADPALVHWTLGGKWLAGFEDVPFGDEWSSLLSQWVQRPHGC